MKMKLKLQNLWQGSTYYYFFYFLVVCLSLRLALASQGRWITFICLLLILTRLYFLGQGQHYVALIFIALALGRTYWVQAEANNLRVLPLEGAEATYLIQVRDQDVKEREDYVSGRAILHLAEGKSISVQFYYSLGDDETAEAFRPGLWQVQAKLSRPAKVRNFYLFDYRSYLEQEGIFWSMTIKTINQIRPYQSLIDRFTSRILVPFRAYSHLAWVDLHNKILWNQDSYIYADWQEEFRMLGILHLFAISGFHLNYLCRLLRYLCLRIGIIHEVVEPLVFGLLLIYGQLINWPVGVVRVLGVSALAAANKRWRWNLSAIDRLSVVGLVILCIQPRAVFHLSFIFSFLATFVIHFYLYESRSLKGHWLQSLELSLACLFFTWPLSMQLNHEWQLSQLVSVLILGAAFEYLLMPLLVGTSLCLWLGWQGPFLALNQAFEFLMGRGNLGAFLQSFQKVVGHLSVGVFIFLVLAAIIWLYYRRSQPALAYGFLAAAYLVFALIQPYWPLGDRLTVLDIGQGDALLYQPAWSRQHWLIDTGGRFDFRTKALDRQAAERTLLPALKALGVDRLTGVLITHPDLDHMGNLMILMDEVPIQTLWLTPYTLASDLWQKMAPYRSARTEILVLPTDRLLNFGKMTHLAMDSIYARQDSNESSVVSLLKVGNKVLMNVGDLGVDSEALLIEHYPDLQADILKLGHHGSSTSTSDAFLDWQNFQLGLISAGVNNRYGHPHPEVISRLATRHLPYLGTYEVGAIQLQANLLGQVYIRTAIDPVQEEGGQ